MLYALHEAAYAAATPIRAAAGAARTFWSAPSNPASTTGLGRTLFATADVVSNLTRRYGRPAWGVDTVDIGNHRVRVTHEAVWSSAWVKLQHFHCDEGDLLMAGVTQPRPALLLVAPLSGHYATLLRGTLQTFLKDHDVYITDWSNARTVPIHEGRFDFHSYIDHVRDMLGAIGRRAHVVAVCQPGPPVMAATALMAEDNDPLRPLSVTLMGSPIDARLSPTAANKLAAERPFTWFQSAMVYTVPAPYPGLMRRVYPGFVQLYGFLSMNEAEHVDAHWRYFQDLVEGDGDNAAKHRQFYDEYLSVLDLTEEFYLQTIETVFQKHLLPKGELVHNGRPVRLEAITDIGLMTVEGGHDDISGVGQTQAAHALCTGIPAPLHELYVNPDAGHYGVFNGGRFRREIYPRIRDFAARIQAAA